MRLLLPMREVLGGVSWRKGRCHRWNSCISLVAGQVPLRFPLPPASWVVAGVSADDVGNSGSIPYRCSDEVIPWYDAWEKGLPFSVAGLDVECVSIGHQW